MLPAAEQDIAYLDVLDPQFRPDSDDVLAAREAGWYARTPIGFAVLRYEQIDALLADRRLRQGGVDSLAAQGITSGPIFDWMSTVIVNVEGEDHQRLRRLVSRAFTRGSIDALRPYLRAEANRLIDRFAGAGGCEFMADFADPYPASVICELLGVPDGQREAFRGWANDLGLAFSYVVAENADRIEAALTGLNAAVADLIEQRRAAPCDDLLSALIAAEEAGDRLSTAELQTMVSALLFAGQDTTRNQLGLAMTTFLDHPEQWQLLAAHPELAPRAAEEVIRVSPTAPVAWRVAAEPLTFNGLAIPAGAFLSLFVIVANAEPRVFGETGFDITADRPPQLAFGGGIHYCLGAALGRAELAEALVILARRLPNPHLAGTPRWRPAMGITGPVTLPLRFATG